MASDAYKHTARLLKSLESSKLQTSPSEFLEELRRAYSSPNYVKDVAKKVKEDVASVERNAAVNVHRLDIKISYRLDS